MLFEFSNTTNRLFRRTVVTKHYIHVSDANTELLHSVFIERASPHHSELKQFSQFSLEKVIQPTTIKCESQVVFETLKMNL